MKKKMISVRLDREDEAKLDVLRQGRSREGWFREMVREQATKHIKENELRIEAYILSMAEERIKSNVTTLLEMEAKLRDDNLLLSKSVKE